MTRLPLICAAALLAAPFAAPAIAQDDAGDRINQVIIYGDDECPVSEGNTITVCARKPESERYRIPPRLRQSGSPQREAWTERAQSLETVGRFGPMSCTPVGAGGELGCTADMIAAAYAERAAGSDVRFSQLIEEARAERMSGIDEEAAEEQRRVEALERAYEEKLARERAAPLPGESTTEPVVVNPDAMLPVDQRPAIVTAEEEPETSSATQQGSVGQ